MLKLRLKDEKETTAIAAAFGRLCVETVNLAVSASSLIAAAFGRLCVETGARASGGYVGGAAAFGRLCVETCTRYTQDNLKQSSRLRAAVC